jgi:hypothetical protein
VESAELSSAEALDELAGVLAFRARGAGA